MTRLRLALAVAVGAAATAAAAIATQMSWYDTLVLGGIGIGVAWAVGIVGWFGLLGSRGRAIGLQAVIVALTVVATVAAGVVVAASQMFINGKDLATLFVILPAAATTGVVVALVLGHRVDTASRSLADLLRGFDDGRPATAPAAALIAPGELAGLASELAATQARLTESRAKTEAVEASRRELVAWVSHDLRTPLSGIQAMVEALEDGVADDPETVTRYYRTLHLETVRLSRLVDDLFELSRLGAEAVRLSPQPASLADMVSDALAGARPAAEAKAVELNGCVVGTGPNVELSRPEFARILRNLIDNAIRHTPSGGEVRIEAAYQPGSATVTVADSCGGIPADELDRVFDLAYRGDVARSSEGGAGAGLGLAIARGLIEAHHGDIAVTNRGPGCAFTVRVPINQDQLCTGLGGAPTVGTRGEGPGRSNVVPGGR